MLTDTQIRNLKPKATLYRVADSHGLCLEVTPSGSKLWRFRYAFAGKSSMISLGPYPLVSLAMARERHLLARRTLQSGIDPSAARKEQAKTKVDEAASKFAIIALAWLEERNAKKSFSPSTYKKASTIIRSDLIPALGEISIAVLTTPQVMKVLRKIEARAPHMAEKAQGYINQIVDHAIKNGLREDGKTLSLKGAVSTPKATSVPAAINRQDLSNVLKVIDHYPCPIVQSALKFVSLTTMRPSNVVEARWEHIDMKKKTWTIPGDQMKNGEEHCVPLPSQAMEILKLAQAWKSRSQGWVFPPFTKGKTPHLHRDTLSKALRENGLRGKHVPHGWRSTYRTLAREEWKIDIDVLEAQIAHSKKGEVNKAYDRAKFLKERFDVMQRWADYLDELRIESLN